MKKIMLNILIIILSQTSFAYEKPEEVTFVGLRPKAAQVTQWYIDIYTEAFSRMGIKFNYMEVPQRRAALYSDTGKVDGDIGRAYNYSEKHPNLIRIEERVRSVELIAYTRDKNLKLSGWESLKGKDLQIEYPLGIRIAENEISKYIPPEKMSVSNNTSEGIRKLLRKRTDVFIEIRDAYEKYKESSEFKENTTEIYEAGLMEAVYTYPHLHKKDKVLAEEFTKILKEMKKDGSFQKYKEKYKINIKW